MRAAMTRKPAFPYLFFVFFFVLLPSVSCRREPAAEPQQAAAAAPAPPKVAWALAIHGGAGTISRQDMGPDLEREYRASLTEALTMGRDQLERGEASLDVVERIVRFFEEDPKFNAGKGAVYNHAGGHELDASIMDGRDLSGGGVAAVSTVKHPISLARLVMEKTRYILLIGAGAEKFATDMGVERVPNASFDTPARYEQWQRELARQEREKNARKYGTVGAVALDRHGNLAAASSTGGLVDKLWGRVGDTPILGAGTYADNRTCAVSGTGTGEQFIRNAVAYQVSALIEYRGMALEEAARHVVHGKLKPRDGGIIAVGRDGSIALVYNTDGMYRGAADAAGRFEVRIWQD